MAKAQVFKEKEYRQAQEQAPQAPSLNDFPSINLSGLNLAGITDDFSAVVTALQQFPVRSSLTLVGALTLLYIGFKLSKKFGIIKSNLKKI